MVEDRQRMGLEPGLGLRLRMELRSEEGRPGARGFGVAELEPPREPELGDDPVFVREQQQLVELGMKEQPHDMVLVELDQLRALAVLLVRLVFAQRAFPWRVPPVS